MSQFYGIIFYAIPFVIALMAQWSKGYKLYKRDLRNCKEQNYDPNLTVGWILSRFIVACIPIVNIIISLTYMLTKIDDLFFIPIVKSQYKPYNPDPDRPNTD